MGRAYTLQLDARCTFRGRWASSDTLPSLELLRADDDGMALDLNKTTQPPPPTPTPHPTPPHPTPTTPCTCRGPLWEAWWRSDGTWQNLDGQRAAGRRGFTRTALFSASSLRMTADRRAGMDAQGRQPSTAGLAACSLARCPHCAASTVQPPSPSPFRDRTGAHCHTDCHYTRTHTHCTTNDIMTWKKAVVNACTRHHLSPSVSSVPSGRALGRRR